MQKRRNKLDDTDHWQSMQFQNGKIHSYFPLPSNQIISNNYQAKFLLMGILFNTLCSISSLSLIITIITIIFLPSSPFGLSLYSTQLICLLIVSIIKQIYFDKVRNKADEKINTKKVKAFRGKQFYQSLNWGDLRQGDIVYLTQGESVPADIILLDSQQIQHRQAITYVDTRKVNGKTQPEKKKACYLTQMLTRGAMQKLNWENYQKIITGKLSFQKPSEQLQSFIGYLKLTKDPKVQKLTINNLILRQSIIKTSLWIYGLVVYTGNNAKIMKNRTNNSTKIISPFQNKLNLIFTICFTLNIFLGLLFSFLYLYRSSTSHSILPMISYHFQIFSILLPHSLYIFQNFFLICFSFFYKQDGLEFRNYQHLHKLGEINMAVLADHGVINSGDLVVDQIVTPSAVYSIKTSDGFKGKKKSLIRRNGSNRQNMEKELAITNNHIKSNRNKKNPFMNINNKLPFDNNQQDQQKFQVQDGTDLRFKPSPGLGPFPKIKAHQLQPLKINKIGLLNQVNQGGQQATQIIKSFVVCHQAKFFYSSQQQSYNWTSNINSQQVLLKLSKDVGWQISPKMDLVKQVGLFIKQFKWTRYDNRTQVKRNHSFDWVGINSFQIQRKLFSVVVKDNHKITLYCKGKPEDIVERMNLNKETQKIIDNTLVQYKNKKAEVIIYAKKQFTQEQMQYYQSEYTNLKYSLTTTQQEINEFSKKWQNKLQFLSIVSLSSQMNPDSKKLIQNLSQSGIKVCMVSNDNIQIDVLKQALQIQNKQISFINFDKQTSQITRYYLNQVTRNIKNNPKYCFGIIINGATWNLLYQNSDILQHFLFIFYYCEGIIAYNFDPRQTAQFTYKIKTSYPQQQKVLSIGNSYGDLKYQDESDISISIQSNLPTDINTQNLSIAIKLISCGPKILQIYVSIISLVLYRLVSLGTAILIFQITLISLNASFTFNKTLVYILLIIYTFVEIIYNLYFLMDFKKQNQQAKGNYYYSKNKNVYEKIYLSIIEAVIHGGIAMGSVLLTLPQIRFSKGKLLSAQATHVAIFLLLIFISNFRIYFQLLVPKIKFIIFTIIILSISALSLFVATLITPSFKHISKQILILISNYDSCTMLINTILFCVAISFFIQQVIKKYLLPEIKFKYSQIKLKKSEMKDQKNDIQKLELIKYLFKEQENIQMSISEFVGDKLDLNSLKINKMVQIRNAQSNMKNLYENHKRNSNNFIKTLILCASIQLVLGSVGFLVLNQTFTSSCIPFIFGIVFTIPLCIYISYGQIKMNYYPLAQISLVIIFIIFCLFAIFTQNQYYFLIFCLLSIITTQMIQIRMIILSIISFMLIIANTVLLLISSKSTGQIAFQIIFTLICVIVNIVIVKNSLIQSKINFIKNQTFQKQTHYVNDILSILVPKFVKKHLENYTENFALQQKQNKVSVLFCYVCNFQAIVKEQGKNVVLIMDQLFRQFDQLCHNFAVQKIQTVGFTYMAATGIKVVEDQMENQFTRKNQVERLLKMGIQMLDKAKSVSWGLKKDKRLTIKVGIHHGDVVIGVIGYHKPQFSLIGDTVNTTSRHCSTGQPGDITLSAVAYQMLKRFSHNSFTKKQKQMKGLGLINVYVYNKIDDINSKHMLIKIKFKNCVNKIITTLREQGKIKYKVFKADDIAKRLADQVQKQQGRKNTVRFTSNPKRRSSLNKIQQLMEDFQKQKNQNIEGKSKDKSMPHNFCLQLDKRNNDYFVYVCKKNASYDQLLMCIIFPICFVNLVYNSVLHFWTPSSIILRVIGIVLYIICIYFYKKIFKADFYLWIGIILMMFILLLQQLPLIFGPQQIQLQYYSFINFKTYFPIILLTIISATSGFRFLHIFIIIIFSLSISIINILLSNIYSMTIIYQFFYYMFVLLRKFLTVRESYNNYIQMINYQKRNKQQSDLVSQLLPKHAYEKLKNQNIQNRLELTDQFEKCTMLYADIKGFTSFSKKHQNQPDIIVQMLRKLFQQFDKKCLQHNVYKVYTIGDCYVVLGFTNCYQRDILQQAKNVVNMGLGMVQHIQLVRQKYNFAQLDMRIGIHTGTVIGGIIGTEIVRYDIYGPDVMITNKFEEKGQTGHIHISQSTKEILDQDKKSPYNIVPHGKVRIQKLNAEYSSYLLSKKKFQI